MASEKVLQEKQAYVAELSSKLSAATTGVIVSYSGITVAEDTALRRQLRTILHQRYRSERYLQSA